MHARSLALGDLGGGITVHAGFTHGCGCGRAGGWVFPLFHSHIRPRVCMCMCQVIGMAGTHEHRCRPGDGDGVGVGLVIYQHRRACMCGLEGTARDVPVSIPVPVAGCGCGCLSHLTFMRGSYIYVASIWRDLVTFFTSGTYGKVKSSKVKPVCFFYLSFWFLASRGHS